MVVIIVVVCCCCYSCCFVVVVVGRGGGGGVVVVCGCCLFTVVVVAAWVIEGLGASRLGVERGMYVCKAVASRRRTRGGKCMTSLRVKMTSS